MTAKNRAETVTVTDDELRTRAERGDTPTAIATALGVSRHTVVGRLTALGLLPVRPTEADRRKAVDALKAAHAARLKAEQAAALKASDEVVAVARCRTAGVTWEVIGAAVGQAQPNAHKKYSPLIEEITTTEVRVL